VNDEKPTLFEWLFAAFGIILIVALIGTFAGWFLLLVLAALTS
jgi:hypothetical protein